MIISNVYTNLLLHYLISRFVLHPSSVAARNSKITPSVKVRPGEATKCIDEFRDGTINVLVSTSVIEEGFDVSMELSLLLLVHLDYINFIHRFSYRCQKQM